MQAHILFKVTVICTLLERGITEGITEDEPPPIETRILGGSMVYIEDAPFMAAMENNKGLLCGAAIITETQVITAAHCTYGRTCDTIKVRVGSTDRGIGGQVLGVKKIHQNPNFNLEHGTHDISILDLDAPIKLSAAAAPIALASSDYILEPDADAKIFGWGSVSAKVEKLSQKLQTVTVKTIDRVMCQNEYPEVAITEQMVCAGVEKGGKDACQGDSGGPFVVDGVLVGVTSWGTGCGQPNHYGVYSYVPNLKPYIDQFLSLTDYF